MGEEEKLKKGKIKYDSEYIAYVESGESAAVFVARDIATGIDTADKWIHIIFHDGLKNDFNVWDFKLIRIELVPRKTKPFYPKGISEEDKKYITWEAAHKDIDDFKTKNGQGPKYELSVKLEKISSGYKVRYYSRVYHRFFDSSMPNADCEKRIDRNITEPEWKYSVLSVKRL